jgi:Zn finger protein HypA/HybF involved in hydrogenase expression
MRTYADRHPETRGRVLWCVTCGAPCSAELLDWWQDCPACREWWKKHPPPSE